MSLTRHFRKINSFFNIGPLKRAYSMGDRGNPLPFLINNQETEPLFEVLWRSKDLIQRVREESFRVKYEDVRERNKQLLQVLDKFEIQQDIVLSALSGNTQEKDVSMLGIGAFQIFDKDLIQTHILSHFLSKITNSYIAQAYEINHSLVNQRIDKLAAKKLHILTSKLEFAVRCFPYVILMDPDDILCLKPDHPKFQQLATYAEIKELGSEEQIQQSYETFLKLVYVGHAMIHYSERSPTWFSQNVSKYVAGGYYLVNLSEARTVTELSMANPTVSMFKLWNTLDEPFIQKFFNLILPSITYDKIVYVDKLYPAITLEAVNSALKRGVWNDVKQPFFEKLKDDKMKDTDHRSAIKTMKEQESPLKFRVVSPIKLEKLQKGQQCLCEELIIHIHGGGWVSGSSYSNQIITRKWANSLGRPIFGLDYGLAPTVQYPLSLDDCWQLYNWLIDNSEQFGVKPKKVILIGDSAGANFVIGLTLLLIKSRGRIPDGLLLAYPALSLNMEKYSPSILRALDDPVLSYSFIELLAKSYLGDLHRGATDPLVSPILINEAHLEYFPPIRMMTGTNDPLHDDIWRFMDRLIKANVDVRTVVYKYFPHGFLSMDMPGGMPEAKNCLEDCIGLIQELLATNGRQEIINMINQRERHPGYAFPNS